MSRRFLNRLFLSASVPVAEHVDDADLLHRFAKLRDEAAFELLVRRHAEGVWRVCRGVLRQEADAEDVFQATFLVLAKRARSIRGRNVTGWLYRVALNASLKARMRTLRQPTLSNERFTNARVQVGQDPPQNLDSAIQFRLKVEAQLWKLTHR